ncbi:MAG TPA: hypothetical protein VKD90_26745, partial [Gemmataceae bacterium]|nr:hypothetical protein [Gemmataceae bacterium]
MHRVSYLPRRARPRLDPLEARDVPATPNVLVSFTVGSDTETVGEFTQTGELVKSAAVPPNGG